MLGAARIGVRGEFHRRTQRGDRLPQRARVLGRLGPVPERVPEVAVPAGLFVRCTGCAGHGRTPHGDGFGERREPGPVLEPVEEDEPQVRQADALLGAALADGRDGVPQQDLGHAQDPGVAALLEDDRHPDGGVVCERGRGPGALRRARQRGVERVQYGRHLPGVLLVERAEPEYGPGDRAPVGRAPGGVAEQIGVPEGQDAEAPGAAVGQGDGAEHLVHRPCGLRSGEPLHGVPLQGVLLRCRAFDLPEDAVRRLLGPHLRHRFPVVSAAGTGITLLTHSGSADPSIAGQGRWIGAPAAPGDAAAPPPVLCGTGGGARDVRSHGPGQRSCSYAGRVRKSA